MKRTLKMALIASLAVGGSYVLYGSQNKLVVGPPGKPVIIETSKEANWVNRYTIPE